MHWKRLRSLTLIARLLPLRYGSVRVPVTTTRTTEDHVRKIKRAIRGNRSGLDVRDSLKQGLGGELRATERTQFGLLGSTCTPNVILYVARNVTPVRDASFPAFSKRRRLSALRNENQAPMYPSNSVRARTNSGSEGAMVPSRDWS